MNGVWFGEGGWDWSVMSDRGVIGWDWKQGLLYADLDSRGIEELT